MMPPLVLSSTLSESFSRVTNSSVPVSEPAKEPFLAYTSSALCTACTARLCVAGLLLVVAIISSQVTVVSATEMVPSILPSFIESTTPSLLIVA